MADAIGLPEGFVLDGSAKETPPTELPEGFTLDELGTPEKQPQEPAALQQIEESPLIRGAGEIAAGFNREILGALDFLGPDTVNAVLELAGSETRVPTFEGGLGAPQGSFVEGTAGEVLGAAGQAAALAAAPQQAIRSIAQRTVPQAGSALSRVLTETAKEGVPAAAALGAVSGAGAELGEEAGGPAGEIVGAVLAPIAVAGAVGAGAGAINRALSNRQTAQQLTDSLGNMSDEGAAKVLATAMQREGLSPADVEKRLTDLGPEAIPADLGATFQRYLRAASNEIPRIEGQAADVLKRRQLGQEGRILAAMDDATGTSSLNVNDEIQRLNDATKPDIDRLYQAARDRDFEYSQDLNKLLTGDNSLGRAQRKVQRRLADKAAVGDEVGKLDTLDASKKELDDQIGKALRQGENEKMRDLVRLKNKLVEEADAAVPEYKEARNLFAGKAQLENAADVGSQFMKLKTQDLNNIVKNMSSSEKEMFKLGAKQDILDRMDNLNFNRDAVNALFGKRGTAKKLRNLFDSDDQLKQFENALSREAQFILTRRQAQANSTTAKQLADEDNVNQVLQDAQDLLTGGPVGWSNFVSRLPSRMAKKKSDAQRIETLEKVGDLLLSSGMRPDKVRSVLERQSEKEISRLLEQQRTKAIKSGLPSLSGLMAGDD